MSDAMTSATNLLAKHAGELADMDKRHAGEVAALVLKHAAELTEAFQAAPVAPAPVPPSDELPGRPRVAGHTP